MPELTIAGPNLSSGATFHIHKAGCRDLKSRAKGYVGREMWTAEFTSLRDIVEDVFSDHMAENDEDSPYAKWTGYNGEFDIFPCVGELPDELVEEEQASEVSQETPESSLQADPQDATVITSSKAPATKGKAPKAAKEAPKVSTKTNPNRRTWNKTQARMVVSRRDKKGMSWAEIGNELGFSPRTARAMFDSVKGEGAHFDSRLEGKGGRTRSITVEEALSE